VKPGPLFIRSASILLAILVCTWDASSAQPYELNDPAKLPPLPPATPEKLPRWRGFNLVEKFQLNDNKPFSEQDFRIISRLGFNFVRLPMDYRIWIMNGDWSRINEQALREIDQAVAFGEKYHIHVCLNFHRAPGYTVASPPESRSVWKDEEAQRVCALHWATFARRYKGIPNERLSFDLFNEPANIDAQTYARVVGIMVEAVRREDSNRLVIVDGLSWGNKPCPELIPLHVAQATRGYNPMQVSHFRASWMHGSDSFIPAWPLLTVSSLLCGTDKPEWQSPLVLEGTFPAGTKLEFVVGTVSAHARLKVMAGDEAVFEKTFVSGPQSTEGEKVVFEPKYQIYQNVFGQKQTVTLTHPASRIAFSNEEGDWLTLGSLAIQPGGSDRVFPLPMTPEWGKKQQTVNFDPNRVAQPWKGIDPIDKDWLWQHQIVPWKALEGQGVGVMVGEWGAYNKTPAEVTLRWMEDSLANFKKAGWGWALWNFRGSFGILDSDRADVTYENYEGHKLDRRMLELLQRY